MEDVPPEILVRSAENCDLEKIQFLAKNPALASGNGVQYSNPRTGTRVSSSRSMFPSENSSMADDPGNSVAGDKGGSLSQNAESSHQLIANKKASPSHSNESPPESVSENERFIVDVVNSENRITNRDLPLNYLALPSCPSSDDLQQSSDLVSVGNIEGEMLVFHDCGSVSSPVHSDSSFDNRQQPSSSGLGFLVSEGEQDHRNGDVLQVDVVSVSSDNVTVGSSELTDHEARQNSRRLFWDSFSRRSSRRNADSRTFVFATDDADGLGSHDRWVLDFNSDLFDDGIRGDSRRYGSGNQITNERRWHSSSEVVVLLLDLFCFFWKTVLYASFELLLFSSPSVFVNSSIFCTSVFLGVATGIASILS